MVFPKEEKKKTNKKQNKNRIGQRKYKGEFVIIEAKIKKEGRKRIN